METAAATEAEYRTAGNYPVKRTERLGDMTIVDALEPLPDQAQTGGFAGTVEFDLPHPLAEALLGSARRHNTTPEAVGFAGVLAVLHRYADPEHDDAGDPTFTALLGRVAAEGGTTATARSGLAVATRGGQGVRCRVDYDPARVDESAVHRFRGHLLCLLAGAVAEPDRPLSRLPLLTPGETARLRAWNATAVAYPTDATVPELIGRQAARTPDATAVTYEGVGMSYRELDWRANQLAHHLRSLGVGPETTVAVCLERSFDLVVALLAVLKSGGVYLPLEPSYPVERLAFMVSDATSPVLLTHSDLAGRVPGSAATVVRLDTDWPAVAAAPGTTPVPVVDGSHTAYLIYTSGSTGRPKGVPNTHAGLRNRMLWVQDTYQLTADDAVVQKTPYGFDVSLGEFLWPLMNGARLVMARPGGHRDPGYLEDLVRAEHVTVVHFVPSMLRAFLDSADLRACPSLRQVVCSGEALPAELVRRFFATGTSAALDNLYGPTETAIEVTRWACTPHDDPVPIGRPVPNTTTHVLDRHGNQMPVGVAGELCLGGIQVARGYLNRPELTRASFVPDPFGPPGARMYRTGDLARWRADGALEYLGRRDHQVKLRGVRIELGEIEATLRAQPDIADAAVLVRTGPSGDEALIGYLVRHGPGGDRDLRARLRSRLPEHMVPDRYVTLDALPLSPNGKLDRAALAAVPVPVDGDRPAYRAARTPLERRLAEIWAEVLDADRVGLDDDFFALGGHSLRAVRVLSRITADLGVTLPLPSLFRAPILHRFAAEEVQPRAARLAALPAAPDPRPRNAGRAPLSSAQRRLWFLHQLHPDLYAYHLPLAYTVDGPLDVNALAGALTDLVRRHHALRTRIEVGPDGEPVQVVAPAEPVPLPVTEVPEVTDTLLRERLRRPFDLTRGPLLRAELFRVTADPGPPDRHVLLVVIHHIAGDEWTLGLLTDELSRLYSARTHGSPAPLPEPPLQYADYALWQRDTLTPQVLDEQLTYWTGRLAGMNPLEPPTDRPRPPVAGFAGRRATVAVPAELMDRLRGVGRQVGATDFMLMVAGLQALLRRYTGQDDIAIGTVTADRTWPGFAELVGFCVNTVVLRTDLSGGPSFTDAVSRVRETALGAYEHQDLPFEKLVEALAPERDTSRSPLFGVAVSYLNTPEVRLRLDGARVREHAFDAGTVRFDLDIFMRERGGGLVIDADYRTDLFDDTTVRLFLDHYLRLLAAAGEAPDRPIEGLDIVGEHERRELAALGRRSVDHPVTPLIPELVTDWARRQPDAPAVRDNRRTFTYRDLDTGASRLAARLSASVAGRDDIVGVLMERCAEYPVALLGVLKAGAAYLPLDPALPDSRLIEMLADSHASAVVTTHDLAHRVAGTAARVVRFGETDEACGPGGPDGGPRPDDLAYVIYTSGSTGRPKGVLVEHRSLLNLCHWHIRRYRITPSDRGTMTAAQGFDASVWELWPYLAAGASVCVADEATRTDPARLTRWLIDQRATITFLATPLAEAVLDDELVDQLPVRVVLTGGDRLRQRPRPGLPFTLVNHYGPTEGTVVATAGVVPDSATGSGPVSIGSPIDNVEVHLLDEHGDPVPRGIGGELHLGGAQLARGYLDRPELTAEHFVSTRFGRLYRTGDLARWRTDGELEFLGRADRQIKVRGFRVEPGEIEARLRAHPEVAEAFVTVHDAGGRQLVGYLVSTSTDGPPDPAALRTWLRGQLPDYMVPTRFVAVPEVPLTANGKVDRARLPEPAAEPAPDSPFVAPRDEVERAIATLFGRILNRDRVGIHDDFFTLGGHSLRAAQLTAGLRRDFDVDLPMRAVFAGPTVAELAVALVETALREGGAAGQ
jgi:amino acid adenylation domain-containing protein